MEFIPDLFAASMAENLLPARMQMAFTLGFHIILACLGVGFPVLMIIAEWRYPRTDDPLWKTLARRWSKAFAVLFAVGAVSGTVLSFELGLLWPEMMGRWGGVVGLPFTFEGFAFFLEAIFVGIYLYGWDRLPRKVHWLTGLPIAFSGFMSAFFVVTANAWMNTPEGFRMEGGKPVDINPLAAMFNEAAPAQVAHMIIAAYLVTGFLVASFYGLRLLRNPTEQYSRRAFTLALLLALPLVPVQFFAGDRSAKSVAHRQPIKLAAMEGLYKTTRHAPLHIGGIPNEKEKKLDFAIEIPGMLSWLAYGNTDAEVKGLDDFPQDELPPVTIVHLAFQAMVGIASLMFLPLLWAGLSWLRKRSWPESKWFLWLLVMLGPLSVVALESGWIVTEVGRQPWIVYGHMRTSEAVTDAPGVWQVFGVTLAVYLVLSVATIVVLRRLARAPLPEETHGAR